MKQKLLLLTMAAIAAQGFAQSPIAYPKTKTVNQVDEYFGVKVAEICVSPWSKGAKKFCEISHSLKQKP